MKIDISQISLNTVRLRLRPFMMEDVQDVYVYASDEDVGEMAGWRRHETVHDTIEVVQAFIQGKNVFALQDKETGKVIGSLGIHSSQWAEKMRAYRKLNLVEIGYAMDKDYWGRGLMPEAVIAAVDWLFAENELDAIAVSHFMSNSQSQRVIEKCGFSRVKKGLYHSSALDRYCLAVFYIMLKDDWRARRMMA